MSCPVAILVVNGDADPKRGRWIDLCLEKIRKFTAPGTFRVYVWNNNLRDRSLKGRLFALPWVACVEAAPYERLSHPHATPLQRLYALARDQGADRIVTMDSDAHPLRHGWLEELTAALDAGAALAGVWRDELREAIAPYVHPSCLATTVELVERHRLRFDRVGAGNDGEVHDTLSRFTAAALSAGEPIHRLLRSNVNNFHRLMGGVYGDFVYHHGAGTRRGVGFRGEPRDAERLRWNAHVRDRTADLLFTDYERYLGWLRGRCDDDSFARKLSALRRTPVVGEGGATGTHGMPAGVKAVRWRGRARDLAKRIPGAARVVKAVRRMVRPGEAVLDAKRKMLTPLAPDDLYELPFGWRVTGPAFVGAGVPKCGTSWWYELLTDHPQVVPNRTRFANSKETQYFIHRRSRPLNAAEIELYRRLFAAPPGAVCGEFSTLYLSYPDCVERVARAAPDARILVILRNPIDRTRSHLNHMIVNRKFLFEKLTFTQRRLVEKHSFYCEAVLHSLYAAGMRRLFRRFDRDRVLVLQYERCCRDPAGELARTYRFLGLNDGHVPDDLRRRVNEVTYALPEYAPEERGRLAAYFFDDARRTAELCPEIDLKLWPDFSGEGE